MTLSRTNSATRPYSPPRPGTADPSRARGNGAPLRPEIWVEGRQAPPFNPMTYATAGMLLSRAASARGLLGFSGQAAAVSEFFARRDWSRLAERLGRVGRWLPTAAGTAQSFAALSQCAEAAQRLLYDLPDPAATETPAAEPELSATVAARAAAPTPRPGQTEPVVRPRTGMPKAPAKRPEDPDLAAIRALIADESRATEPKRRRKSRRKPAARRPGTPNGAPNLRSRIGRWTTVRLLAGGGLALALPFGFGRALWRHLDGTDLRELVAEFQQPPGKQAAAD